MKNWPMWLGPALGLAAFAIGITQGSTEIESWQLATRYTARVGFPLLILAYVARPLFDLTRAGWSRAIVGKRKWIGLGFATAHTVHLIAIINYFRLLGEAPAMITLVFGGFAYVLLFAMALTSNRAAMQALGKRWKLLHRTGIHYLWFIFFQSYAKRIVDPETLVQGLIGTSIALGAAGLRFAAWRRARNKR